MSRRSATGPSYTISNNHNTTIIINGGGGGVFATIWRAIKAVCAFFWPAKPGP